MYVTTLCLGKKLVSDSIRTENRMHIYFTNTRNVNKFFVIVTKHPGELAKRKDTIYVLLTNHLKQFINKISITRLVTVDETNNLNTNRIEGPTLKSQTYLQSLIFPRKTYFFNTRPFNSLLVNLSPGCRPRYKNSKSRQGLI